MERKFKILKLDTGQILLDHVKKADTFVKRLIGLMGKRRLEKGHGLFLEHVSSIHTCFMKFPIEAVYLDGDYRILDFQMLKPWRCGKIVKGARHVLEMNPEEGELMEKGANLAVIEDYG